MKKSIGFIGGGRITRIILQAFKNKNISLDKIVVYDVNQETCKKLNQDFPSIKISNLNNVAEKDIVFIALHAPVIIETLEMIKKTIRKESIFISLANKITISQISAILNAKNVVRFQPNATSMINKGYNILCFPLGFKEKSEVKEVLSPLGNLIETEEIKLEAYAIISAMLPTYFWFQWYELIEIARQIGLSGLESKEAMEQTLAASIDLMFKSDLTKDEVLDLIPVKPLGEGEVQIAKMFHSKLIGLFTKIKPFYEPIL